MRSPDACSLRFPGDDPLSTCSVSVTEPLGPTGLMDQQRYRKSFNTNFNPSVTGSARADTQGMLGNQPPACVNNWNLQQERKLERQRLLMSVVSAALLSRTCSGRQHERQPMRARSG